MRIRSILNNTIFTLQVLLVFLVLFESFISIPTILQPLGRMHPLVLHFPVVLILISFAFQFMRSSVEKDSFERINDILLYSAAFTTTITALMGLFLSREGGYGSGLIDQHKWTGKVTH